MPLVPLVRLSPRVVAVAEDLREDLAEAEGHEGQVVALQPQRRRADDDAGDAATTPATIRTSQNVMWMPGKFGSAVSTEVDVDVAPARRDVDREDRHQPGGDVGAEQEERDVAEVEQAGVADDDVEAECEQHVHGAQRPR